MKKSIATALCFALATALGGCAVEPKSLPAVNAGNTPVAEGSALGVFTSDAAGFNTQSHWLDTGLEVVVFDAQFTEAGAQAVIASIRAKTKSPIRYLVITHPNPDKFNGAEAFRAIGAKVIASEATKAAIPAVHAYKKYYFVNIAKSFTDATYPKEPTIDFTFNGDYSLPLAGSAQVKLHQLKSSGVAATQTVAFIPAVNSLVVGDLVHSKAHAWLEGPIVAGKPAPNLDAWRNALNELLAYPGATVLGGRGETAKVENAVAEQQAYLTKMDEVVTQYIAALGAKKSELGTDAAGGHYKKITEAAQKAFPGYTLPYMIEYGVYGLVNQRAAQK
jgi:glyoxylase-like metal-dependent hydrolase (beta-lactamase superfamily II)